VFRWRRELAKSLAVAPTLSSPPAPGAKWHRLVLPRWLWQNLGHGGRDKAISISGGLVHTVLPNFVSWVYQTSTWLPQGVASIPPLIITGWRITRALSHQRRKDECARYMDGRLEFQQRQRHWSTARAMHWTMSQPACTRTSPSLFVSTTKSPITRDSVMR
jgi:hypothetical protein